MVFVEEYTNKDLLYGFKAFRLPLENGNLKTRTLGLCIRIGDKMCTDNDKPLKPESNGVDFYKRTPADAIRYYPANRMVFARVAVPAGARVVSISEIDKMCTETLTVCALLQGRVVSADGRTECYFENGKFHRKEGPALIRYDAGGKLMYEVYYNEGRLDRPIDEGPAEIEYKRGRIVSVSYWVKDKMHYPPERGPAFISYYTNGIVKEERYCNDGVLHRPPEHGPAEIYYNSKGVFLQNYWVNGDLVTYVPDADVPDADAPDADAPDADAPDADAPDADAPDADAPDADAIRK